MIEYTEDEYDDAHQLVACSNDWPGFYKFLEHYFGDDEGGISIYLEDLRAMASDAARGKWLARHDHFDCAMDTVDIYNSDMWLDYVSTVSVNAKRPNHDREVTCKSDGRIIVRDYYVSFKPYEKDSAVALVASLIKEHHITTEDLTAALL